MALNTSNTRSVERNFGHCVLMWKIKNFSLVFCKPGTRLQTPEFTIISLKVTCWQIGLRFVSEKDKLQIVLRRLDSVEESFNVCWKVTIFNDKNESLRLSENRFFFVPNSSQQVDLLPVLDVVASISADEPDGLKLEIQIIVYMNSVMIIPTPTDSSLRKLVDDMALLHRQGLHSDMTLKINGQSLKVHRAMLYPRSEMLTCSTLHNRKPFKFHFDDAAAVNRIITYLYTGDLLNIFNPPSISIYECIVNLDIKELRDSYPQQKYTFETVLEAEKFEFQWTINNFNNIDESQDSDVYEAGTMDVCWRLRIHPKGLREGSKMEKKYVCIEALAVSCEGTQDVYVDFKSMDEKGKALIRKRAYGKIIAGKKLLILFARIGGSSIVKSTIGNSLNLSFSVHVATGNTNTDTIDLHPPVVFNLTNFETFKLLTTYLGILQTSDAHSDVTLLVQNQEVRSHKFLLAGRSVYFSHMLERIKDDCSSLTVCNAERHVFRVFLDFLYTATMTDISVQMLVHLYDLSVRFDVKTLRDDCLRRLTEQITPEISIFLLLFADDRQLSSLKSKALDVISAHRHLIVNSDNWTALQINKPELFYDLLHFLRDDSIRRSWAGLDDIPLP